MARYIAWLDGEAGAYGIAFHDLPGCTAMGTTVDETLANAAEALRDWVEVTEARGHKVPEPTPPDRIGEPDADHLRAVQVLVPLVRDLGRPVKANLSLDSGVLTAIDAAAERLGVTRSALVELLAKRGLPELA
jgi:predicted RNase H-like HicB family nuclease